MFKEVFPQTEPAPSPKKKKKKKKGLYCPEPEALLKGNVNGNRKFLKQPRGLGSSSCRKIHMKPSLCHILGSVLSRINIRISVRFGERLFFFFFFFFFYLTPTFNEIYLYVSRNVVGRLFSLLYYQLVGNTFKRIIPPSNVPPLTESVAF